MTDTRRFQQAIDKLERQRSMLGDDAVDTAIAALRRQLSAPAETSGEETGGERKVVTLMFADLSGFTALAEQLDPEVVRNLINMLFERLARVITRYGGFIEKYIGDEIMAMFGAPLSYEDHAERALCAALEMMAVLPEFNEAQHTGLGLHIGVNTGNVVTGIIGAQEHKQYGVTGDAVNLAARLKQSATRGEIFVGAETYRLTNRFFDFASLPSLVLKGKSGPQEVYRLVSRKTSPADRWTYRPAAPMIGRQPEEETLREAVDALRQGRGGCVAIVGEAGIGKSRLVAEIRKGAGADIDWIEGRSLSYSRESSYLPVQEALGKLLEMPSGKTPTQVKALLKKELEKPGAGDLSDTLPFLAHLLQLPLSREEEERVRYLPADALNARIKSSFRAFVEARAKRCPLVLVWEDLHWADPASLRLIESLPAVSAAIPLLTLLVFRPAREEPVWAFHESAVAAHGARYRVLNLEALSRETSSILVRQLVNVETISPALAELIYSRTEGNPFFVEELVRSLLDKGELYTEDHQIKASPGLQTADLPTTLQGVIASRIDRLSARDKEVLQTAAVLGRIFRRGTLDRLLTHQPDGAGSGQALAQLLQREFIRKRPASDGDPEAEEYIFKHVLTQEVAYNSLLLSRRERLHHLAGETYETMAGDKPEELAAVIAYHFERTPDRAGASRYLELGGDWARRRHVNEEAINLYARALRQMHLLREHEGDTDERQAARIALFEKLADVQEVNGQHQQAITSYEKALDDAPEADAMVRARLYRKCGVSCNSARMVDRAAACFAQAETLLLPQKHAGDPSWWLEWIELGLDRVFHYYWTGQSAEMEACLKAAASEVRDHGTPGQRARFFQNLTMYRMRTERFAISEQTLIHAREMIAASREFDDVRILALSKFLYGLALLSHDDFEKSLAALDEGAAIAERLGDVINQVRCLNYLTIAHRRLGNVEETHTANRRTLALATTLNLQEYLASTHATQAWLAWKQDDDEAAVRLGREALRHWNAFENMIRSSIPWKWMAAWPLLAVYHRQGNRPACLEMLELLLAPDQRPLEPDLKAKTQQVVTGFRKGRTAHLTENIEHVLKLAARYMYL